MVLASAVLLNFAGLVSVGRKLTLGLLAVAALAAGLIAGFIAIIPSFNCVLMRDHSVVEQPFASENLTQRMTAEAVDFIERWRMWSAAAVFSSLFYSNRIFLFLFAQEFGKALPSFLLFPPSAHGLVRFSSVQRDEPARGLRRRRARSGLECRLVQASATFQCLSLSRAVQSIDIGHFLEGSRSELGKAEVLFIPLESFQALFVRWQRVSLSSSLPVAARPLP